MNDKDQGAKPEPEVDEYQIDTVVDRVADRVKLATEKRVVTTRDVAAIASERARRKLEDATRELRKKRG